MSGLTSNTSLRSELLLEYGLVEAAQQRFYDLDALEDEALHFGIGGIEDQPVRLVSLGRIVTENSLVPDGLDAIRVLDRDVQARLASDVGGTRRDGEHDERAIILGALLEVVRQREHLRLEQ